MNNNNMSEISNKNSVIDNNDNNELADFENEGNIHFAKRGTIG